MQSDRPRAASGGLSGPRTAIGGFCGLAKRSTEVV
jgi:hypothetical protein